MTNLTKVNTNVKSEEGVFVNFGIPGGPTTPSPYIEAYHIGIKIAFVVTCLISLVISVVAITALRRTRKIPPSVKFLATALLSFDCLHIVLSTARKFVLNPLYNTTLMVLGLGALQFAFFTVGVMTAERYFVFQNPMTYMRVCTPRFLRQVTVTVWLVEISAFLFTRYGICYAMSPSIQVFREAGFCNSIEGFYYLIVVGSTLLLSILCYVRIIQIIREKTDSVNFPSVLGSLRSFKSTSLVFVYLIVIVCTSASYVIITAYVRAKQIGYSETRIALDTVSMLNCLIDPFLYVLWFKECRMEVLKMIEFLSEDIQGKVTQMRLEIFAIVTYDKDEV